jgi:hypothetical protein
MKIRYEVTTEVNSCKECIWICKDKDCYKDFEVKYDTAKERFDHCPCKVK